MVSDTKTIIDKAINIRGWSQINCFAHTLNRILISGISEIQEVVAKIKQVVEYFKESSLLQEMLKQLNMP